jgi:hypothetical protein
MRSGSPMHYDRALDPLIAFGNCRARFKAESQLSVRKLLYGRPGLRHTPALNLSHYDLRNRCCCRHARRQRTACDWRGRQRDAPSREWPPGLE